MAVPVFDRYGKVLGAISVIGPSERMSPGRCKSVAAALRKQIRLLRFQIAGNGRGPISSDSALFSKNTGAEKH